MSVTDPARLDLGGNVRRGDPNTWSPKLWSYLRDLFAVKSMLDVGCGEGHAVAFFQRMGVLAHGIDGLLLNVQRSVVPIAHHDILTGPYVMPVDFVWSCEVAEHILPQYVHHYIATLTNAPIVAMTHAVPGQGGHHHVNCQPSEYWIDLMTAAGYQLFSQNEAMRRLSSREEVPPYFQHTGMIFVRR